MGGYFQWQRLASGQSFVTGAKYNLDLPSKGLLSSLMFQVYATPVNDARIATEKWRLIDFIDGIDIKANGTRTIKALTGQLAHYLQYRDGGASIVNQHHNYGTSTLRQHFMVNFGRWPRDRDFGLPLEMFDNVELILSNDGSGTYFTGNMTVDILGLFYREADAGAFKGFLQTEVYKKYTTAAAGVENTKLPTEGMLRRLVMQVIPDVDANMVAETTPYNVAYNIKVTKNSRAAEIWNDNLRYLWYANAFESDRDALAGAETYHTDGYGVHTGLGQTLYKAGSYLSHDGGQSTYAPDFVPGEDSSTQTRQCDGDSDQFSALFAGLALENCAELDFSDYGGTEGMLDLEAEKDVEVEITTRDAASAADGTIRIVTDRVMLR